MNGFRTKFFKPVLVGAAIALLVTVNFTQRQLDRDRATLGLTRRDNPLENAPPVLAFTTVALGGFRGLIANALWIRASDLEDEGKYFEVVQLADWITKLEPYFATVWIHQAWNMAYNISVKFSEPRERWLWVQRGMELLRDEGLKYNPHDALIYRELAWFFQHKMGQDLDDAHEYYKSAWAAEMGKLFEKGRAHYPELLNPESDAAKARVKLLGEKYKMDPKRMKTVDDAYGPLDWRLPESHAIYWAMLGLEKSKKKEEFIQLRRVIYHSLQLAFHRGRMIEIKAEGNERRFELGPNLDMIPNANKAYENMMAQDAEYRDHIKTGHRNFLLDAVYFLYENNRIKDAADWFQKLKERYPDWLKNLETTNPDWYRHIKEKYPDVTSANITVEDFAYGRIMELVGETSHDKITALVQGYLVNHFYSLANGDEDRAAGALRIAQQVWTRFQAKTADPQQQKRVGLAPFNQTREEILQRMLDPQESMLSPAQMARLRTELRLPAPTNAPPAKTP